MSLSVLQSLRGKSIFITGTTGFVGKVLVEKILRDVPDIGRIYLLIRGKAKERLQKEILESKIFTRLRSQREDFDQFANSKVVAVGGDVLLENVGISPEEVQILQQEIHYVVHCAATVDFRERLDNAIKKNVLGTLQLFELAKTFRNLKGFIHVSTAYVNSDRPGFHPEELPPLNFDPEEIVQLALQMDPKELERVTPKLLGTYPNTYTYTKAICERILEKRRGNIPLSFVRPTIVGCSWKEPIPGWIDSVSAIAAVILYTGVGIVRFIKGDGKLICDIVPVDTVCNIILASIPAVTNEKINIYHVGTSQANPVRWHEAARWVSAYWRSHNVKRRVDHRPLKFKIYPSHIAYRTHYFLRYEIPAQLYSIFAKVIGTPQHKKNAELLQKMTSRTLMVTSTFVHFTSTQWIFDVTNTEKAVKMLVPEERAKFDFGVTELDWEKYYRFFCYGMQKFVLQEDVKPPTDLLKIDLVQEPRRVEPDRTNYFLNKFFPDIAWSYKTYKTNMGIDNFMTLRTPDETKALVLKTRRVVDVIKQVAETEKVEVNVIERRAHAIIDRMAHTLRLPVIRALGWFLRKVWRRIYNGIHVEEKGIENIRKVLGNGPIVLVPTHRSYVDFLIVSYIFFEYDLPLPHIAAGEDFLAVMFVNWVFRNSGAFFMRRSFKNDPLYTAIFTEYVQRLICDWSPIEFFIEGKRSRSGKSLHPKYGLLNICMDPFFAKKVPDVTVVPISITYDKTIEAELYSNELLGESKTKESFQGLIRASSILQMNFGRIHVIFNDPISVKEYTNNLSIEAAKTKPAFDPFADNEDRRHIVHELGYKVVHELNQGLVLTTSALVATVILTYRKGITPSELVQKVDWLREEIHQRGASVAYEGSTEDLVENALKLLKNLVAKVRGMYIPISSSIEGDKRNKSVLVLDFYRNQLLHLFTAEGMVACVISSSLFAKDFVISKSELIKNSQFLNKLLQLEFVNKPSSSIQEDFSAVIDSLVERGILTYENKDSGNPMVRVTDDGEGPIYFLGHLFWPLIDSYWISALSLFSLQPNLTSKKKLLLQKISWLAEKMFSEGKISFFESCSMEVLSNCIDLFHSWKIVTFKEPKTQAPRKGPAPTVSPDEMLVALVPPYNKESSLQEVVETINRFRKTSPAPFPSSKKANLRRAVMAEFPVLAKL